MNGELTLPISYFGKLPGQDDFLKFTGKNQSLIANMDRWAGQALEKLAQDVAWKQLYDAGSDVSYAVLSSRKHHAIAGHLLPSHDRTGRRFPFISSVSMEVPQPLAFISRSPLAFSRLWSRLRRSAHGAHDTQNPRFILDDLVENRANVNVLYETLNPAFQDFLEMHTLGSLNELLADAGHPVSVNRILVGLGVLLQPIMGAGSSGMGKGLVLPLPRDPMYRNLVSCLWLDLLSGFLGRADFDVLVLQRNESSPLLAVSFKGLDGRNLQAMFDRKLIENNYIELYSPDWVDEHMGEHSGLGKLTAYTEHDNLSLRVARATFRETFLGV